MRALATASMAKSQAAAFQWLIDNPLWSLIQKDFMYYSKLNDI